MAKRYKLADLTRSILIYFLFFTYMKKITHISFRQEPPQLVNYNEHIRVLSQPNNDCNVFQAQLIGHAKVCLMISGVNRLLPDMA